MHFQNTCTIFVGFTMRASPFLLSSRGHRSDDSTGYEVETEDESYVGYQRAVRGKNVHDVKSLLDPPAFGMGSDTLERKAPSLKHSNSGCQN